MGRLSILVFLLLAASVALARPGSVRTKDGRNIEGDITENDNQVTVATKVASVTFNRGDIASITYAANIKEQYEKRLAALPANAGAKSHLDLARWLYDSKEYTLAKTEVDKTLELDPNHAEAVMLRQTIERSAMWDKATPPAQPAKIAAAVGPTTRPGASKDRRLLTVDQINIIRQMELKETERPRVQWLKDVKRRYMEHSGLTAKDFNAIPDSEKAIQILKNGMPEMRVDVRIASDPASLAEYKRVQPMLLTGCASTICHGSTRAGTFMLYNPAENEQVTYTNFYILTQYNPFLRGVLRKSIDRQQPKASLIAEYGLPMDDAQWPHPKATNWAPVFRGRTDAKYLAVTNWISSLSPLEPEYGIKFALPGGAPATQPVELQAPTEGPATQPNRRRPFTPEPDAAPADTTTTPPDQRPGNSEGGTDDTLKEIRGRMRPIRGL